MAKVEHIFSLYRLPLALHSDNAPEFTGKIWTAFTKLCSINVSNSHPTGWRAMLYVNGAPHYSQSAVDMLPPGKQTILTKQHPNHTMGYSLHTQRRRNFPVRTPVWSCTPTHPLTPRGPNPRRQTPSPQSKIAYIYKNTPTWPKLTPPPTTPIVSVNKSWSPIYHAYPNAPPAIAAPTPS